MFLPSSILPKGLKLWFPHKIPGQQTDIWILLHHEKSALHSFVTKVVPTIWGSHTGVMGRAAAIRAETPELGLSAPTLASGSQLWLTLIVKLNKTFYLQGPSSKGSSSDVIIDERAGLAFSRSGPSRLPNILFGTGKYLPYQRNIRLQIHKCSQSWAA